VRKWREAKKMTLTDLARSADITKGYLSQVESGKIKNPSDGHLIDIAQALGIPVLVLVLRQLPE